MHHLGKGLRLAEELKGEGLYVKANEKEEMHKGPGHIWNVLHKWRAELKKRLRTLTSPPTKRKAR